MSINLFQSSLWVINTHFFLNHTLFLCKAIVVTKQIFSSHKNPHYYYEKKQKTKNKTIYRWKLKSFEIAEKLPDC